MTPNNPLKQYFRQPAIYIKLPSNGKFYAPGSLDMPPNNELPVYPMTAIDEITYRTPDALFNGSAVVNVIQSCVPNIRNAWEIPSMDVDTILVSIRIASYGHQMDFETKCPSCGHECEHTLDLRSVIDQIRAPNYDQSMRHGDIELYFRPMTYKNLNDNNLAQFEEQRILQGMTTDELPDADKMGRLTEALKKLNDITVKALSQSIGAVKTPDALVTEPEYIEELLNNCDRNLFNQIRDYIIEIKTQGEMRPFQLECLECHHQYDQMITLDLANFFGVAS